MSFRFELDLDENDLITLQLCALPCCVENLESNSFFSGTNIGSVSLDDPFDVVFRNKFAKHSGEHGFAPLIAAPLSMSCPTDTVWTNAVMCVDMIKQRIPSHGV